MGKFGLKDLFFPENTQKGSNLGFRASFFFPQELSEMGKRTLYGLFFSPKTPRNGSVWVSGPLSPQEHSEMGKFGLQGLYFIFYPQNTQKWANSGFRASFSPQERSEMGQFGS